MCTGSGFREVDLWTLIESLQEAARITPLPPRSADVRDPSVFKSKFLHCELEEMEYDNDQASQVKINLKKIRHHSM
jgi:hypothetical protein